MNKHTFNIGDYVKPRSYIRTSGYNTLDKFELGKVVDVMRHFGEKLSMHVEILKGTSKKVSGNYYGYGANNKSAKILKVYQDAFELAQIPEDYEIF